MLNRGIALLIKIHQKLCTRREQSNSSSTEESIELKASYSSNTSEETIEYTERRARQGIVIAYSESDEDICQLILKWALMKRE